MTNLAYHGTDRMNFSRFDIAAAGVCNIGLHFGTKAAAESHTESSIEFFDAGLVAVVGEEMVKYGKSRARRAA